jgi:hypothetical protein
MSKLNSGEISNLYSPHNTIMLPGSQKHDDLKMQLVSENEKCILNFGREFLCKATIRKTR